LSRRGIWSIFSTIYNRHSASLVIQTKNSSLGSWNPKWVGCVIKSKPIRMPDFTPFATRF
jgi:hypothetical protein